jgi:glycosyltransferase involved in cell wall biosynthesis
MRIALLIPGTGTLYCGSCLRDHALALALRRLGHEATAIPLYLPFRLDEPEASAGTPLFFGGVNVYLQQHLALFRKTPRWLDALFNSTALLAWAARLGEATQTGSLAAMTLSMLRGDEGRQAKELDKLVEWMAAGERPDVVCLSNILLAGLARRIRRTLRVPVACTLQGEDTFLDALPPPARDEAWSLLRDRAADIDLFLPVSRYYGDAMARRLALGPDRLRVVLNAIPLDGFSPADAPPIPTAVGYLARMTPAKGLGTLVDAFIRLKRTGRTPSLRLRVAGTQTSADRAYVSGLQARLADAGFRADADFLPNIDREAKQAFLRTLTVFSVPATYGESFGLYVLEALASGVPVVQPRHAAFPELLEATGGGLLVDPDDPAALADGLETLLRDPGRAWSLGAAGREVVLRHFGIDRMARELVSVLERIPFRESVMA